MRKLFFSIAFLVLNLCNTSFAKSFKSDPVWIITDQQAATKIQSQFNSEKISRNKELVLLKMDQQELKSLTAFMHQWFHRCAGYTNYNSEAEALDALENNKSEEGIQKTEIEYQIKHDEVVFNLLSKVDTLRLKEFIAHFSSYPDRTYDTESGQASQHWLFDKWQELTLVNRPDITVNLINHNWLQPTIELVIQGKITPEKEIVIGGHGDSINIWGIGAPGADDNATGIAIINEIIHIIVNENFEPSSTLRFYSYAAEEVGLRGSRHVAQKLKADEREIIGALQLDMAGFHGSEEDIVLISDYTNIAQNNFLSQLIEHYLQLSWTFEACGYACSDHASWNAQGYAASFPFEATIHEINPYIHTTQDTLEKLDHSVEHVEKFVKLALAYMVEMSL